MTAGTPPYLDPFLDGPGRGRFDSAAERYAAAVMLFEMATGGTPVYGDGLTDPGSVSDDADADGPSTRLTDPGLDAGAVERDESPEQVPAPPLEQVQRQPGPAAQHVGEGFLSGALQQQRPPAADLERTVDEPYEAGVFQPGQHLGLPHQPGGRCLIVGDLEHPHSVRAGHQQVGDEQPDGGRPRLPVRCSRSSRTT